MIPERQDRNPQLRAMRKNRKEMEETQHTVLSSSEY